MKKVIIEPMAEPSGSKHNFFSWFYRGKKESQKSLSSMAKKKTTPPKPNANWETEGGQN